VVPWGREGSSTSFLRSVSAGTLNMKLEISQMENARSDLTSPGEKVAFRTADCCARLRSFID